MEYKAHGPGKAPKMFELGCRKVTLNKTPKGIMRSAVPLPCFFDVVKLHRVAGQRPQQGTKSCRMVRNSVRLYIRPSNHPLGIEGPLWGLPKGYEGLPEGSESLP